mmetsp:Transcript_8107/g.26084  ORF Transcript_8107/g.26084 Transcript_8107/m.26084 type:complete len:454 (-) Transcript_8107:466-1827(-)
MLSYLTGALAFSGNGLVYEFSQWKEQHGKSYESADAEAAALASFSKNDAIIHSHNAKNLSYTLGHNEWSDMTWAEFSTTVMSELFLNRNSKNARRIHLKDTEHALAIPSEVDWVAQGAVTKVKNQARCGSCWAFSTIGAVEGGLAISTGKLVSLSEEELVQCDTNGDHGCSGGLMDNAFEWIAEGNPLCTEDEYPYTSGAGITGMCQKNVCSGTVVLTAHKDVPIDDEDALMAAVAQNPVSVAIEADQSAFQLYKSGVLDSDMCGKKLDHGVLVVGYGTDADTGLDFWKVKNSWGSTWGEEGYIRMVRGKNMCGIATQASYPKGVKMAPPSPGPTPPKPPAPVTSTHYGDPKLGCLSDEMEVQIQGLGGDFCTSSCGLFKRCPPDVPDGVSAKPQCTLKESGTMKEFCALICAPEEAVANGVIVDQAVADAQCGDNASCKVAGVGVGLCTYDD